jgi:hypothetical protein
MPPSNNNQSINDLLKTASPSGQNDPFADVKAEMADRFTLLPEELQKVILGSNYQQQLFEIAKKHKMTFEELGTLELETTMVLLGMTRPEEYRDEIQIQLKKNESDIEALVKDINENVFTPVRGSLERVFTAKKDPIEFVNPEPTISDAPAMHMQPPAPVPAPAPTPIPTPAPVSINILGDILSPAEKTVLEKTGVILNDAPAIPEAVQQSNNPIIAPATISPERNEMLHDIEFPPKSNPSIMPTIQMPPVSMPDAVPVTPQPIIPVATQPIAPPAQKNQGDPYREPIS